MNLNAKDDGQQLLARKGEAVPSEAMRTKPVAVALTDATGFVLSRDSSSGKSNSGTTRKSDDGIGAAASSPPSSLLDYRLVRVSSRPDDGWLDDGPPQGVESAAPTTEKLTGTVAANVVPLGVAPHWAWASRRFVKCALLLFLVLLASVILINALSS